jgi:hypothetical protein
LYKKKSLDNGMYSMPWLAAMSTTAKPRRPDRAAKPQLRCGMQPLGPMHGAIPGGTDAPGSEANLAGTRRDAARMRPDKVDKILKFYALSCLPRDPLGAFVPSPIADADLSEARHTCKTAT